MKVRVALAQIVPEKAKVDQNLDAIADAILQAESEGADLVTFAECIVSAYFLEGGVLECALDRKELADKLAARLKGKLKRPIDAHLGFYEMHDGQVYNSAGYLELGPDFARTVHVYRKFFLPTYGVFDEERFCARGRELGIVQTRFGTMGVLICEDVWHSILPTLLAVRGAHILQRKHAEPEEPRRMLAHDTSDKIVQQLRHCRPVRTEPLRARIVDAESRQGDAVRIHARQLRVDVEVVRRDLAQPVAHLQITNAVLGEHARIGFALFHQRDDLRGKQVALTVDPAGRFFLGASQGRQRRDGRGSAYKLTTVEFHGGETKARYAAAISGRVGALKTNRPKRSVCGVPRGTVRLPSEPAGSTRFPNGFATISP